MVILNTKNLGEKSDKDLERLMRNLSIEYKDSVYNKDLKDSQILKRLMNVKKEYNKRGMEFITDIKGH
jgi:hypothetical protein